MNVGVMNSPDNSFIWFLNPGDCLKNDQTLIELYESMKIEQTSWGFAQAITETSERIFPQSIEMLTSDELLKGNLSFSHQAMIVKRSTLIEVDIFDTRYKICADLALQTTLLSYQEPSYILKPFVLLDETGISHKHIPRVLWENHLIRVRSKIFSYSESLRILITKSLSKLLKKVYQR
jgi:hypothetical protein